MKEDEDYQFHNLIRLIESNNSDSVAFGLCIAHTHASNFESYFGYKVEDYKYLYEALHKDFNIKELTLKSVAYELDLYQPKMPDSHQTRGWYVLEKMVKEKVEAPSEQDLRSIHPFIRKVIMQKWGIIKRLKY